MSLMINNLNKHVDLIEDIDTKIFTLAMMSSVNENNWLGPSARDHHLKDECGEWGNAVHTIRVTVTAMEMARLLDLGQYQCDILRSAALLHDCCKHGIDGQVVAICYDHPQLAVELIRRVGVSHDPLIDDCIAMHMGRWGKVQCDWLGGKITLPYILHSADCIESKLSHILG